GSDAMTGYLSPTTELANQNLRNSRIKDESICYVGNTMIDTLLKQMDRFIKPDVWDQVSLKEKKYLVITLHRPANVDQQEDLKILLDEIVSLSQGLPIIFPVHPRTAQMLAKIGIKAPNLYLVDPLSYLEFNYLVKYAKADITDSGGITEETTVMGIPCMT